MSKSSKSINFPKSNLKETMKGMEINRDKMAVRRRVSVHDERSMQKMRYDGLTLQRIAEYMGFSIFTVYTHTLTIPHVRRHQGRVLMNRQTGKAKVWGRRRAA